MKNRINHVKYRMVQLLRFASWGMIILLLNCQSTWAQDAKESMPSQFELADSCHPSTSGNETQYIIGYGSLMEQESKQRTSPLAGPNLPIRVQGFERGWMIHGSVYSMTTYLAIITKPNAQMNAVIYSVSEAEILKTDTREEGYCRILVAPKQFQLLSGTLQEDAEIWIYVVPLERVNIPTPQFPIVQSYVDIVIKGCMQLEEKYNLPGFAEECVTTTSNWSKYWVNDRIFPRRPFIYEPQTDKIDTLLRKTIQVYYNQRTIE